MYLPAGDVAVANVDGSVCPAGKPWFVGDEDAGGALVDAVAEDAHDIITGGGVEGAGGFIGQ